MLNIPFDVRFFPVEGMKERIRSPYQQINFNTPFGYRTKTCFIHNGKSVLLIKYNKQNMILK